MDSKLDVTVAMDIGSGTIAITPVGGPTLRNVPGLPPFAQWAASLAPGRDLLQGSQRTAPPQGAAA